MDDARTPTCGPVIERQVAQDVADTAEVGQCAVNVWRVVLTTATVMVVLVVQVRV